VNKSKARFLLRLLPKVTRILEKQSMQIVIKVYLSGSRAFPDLLVEFSLEDVRQLIKKKRTREIKSLVPWGAWDFLMTVSLSKWEEICLQSFEVIEGRLRALVERESADVFKNFTTFGLAADAWSFFLLG